MEKADVTRALRERVDVALCTLKKVEGSVDVGADELSWRGYGTIDVRLGGEMKDCARPLFFKERGYERLVVDVALDETESTVGIELGDVLANARVGEIVEHYDSRRFGLHPSADKV